MSESSVLYLELHPSEFKKRIQEHPVAYLPLGTLEWHGEHLPLGMDAIGSQALMIAAARRYGGIVLPALWLGPDRWTELEDGRSLIGMDYAKSTSPRQPLPGSCYWVSYDFFKELLANILGQLKRAGFKTVFADGHGPSRRTWVEMIPEWENRFDLKLIGVSDSQKEEWGYMIDHAAFNETSIVLALRPELVNLSVFPEGEASPLLGVNGEHPARANAEAGRSAVEKALIWLGNYLG